ncbi:hypothetical protein BMD96_16515 [Klebsiella quasipneumoniae subsp. similipneumoniae]|nr:hypothetical protein BMD96_16515 [Klebsiella quasipneumoniae subsp. similipneumoniae]OVV85211.1 hypothetical protein BME62_18920 [Klebsiella quasipneumoniae subsp. similipneumoniae]
MITEAIILRSVTSGEWCTGPGYRPRRPVTPVSAAPPGRHTPHSKKPRTFRDGVLVKTQKQKAQPSD